MEKKKKKKKVILWTVLGLTALIGGSAIAYKKSPKFKGLIDSGASKLKDVFKKKEVVTKSPKRELPEINLKPYNRKYERL